MELLIFFFGGARLCISHCRFANFNLHFVYVFLLRLYESITSLAGNQNSIDQKLSVENQKFVEKSIVLRGVIKGGGGNLPI